MNRIHKKTPNSNDNPTPTRWRPGEPIPRDVQIDPYETLRRNAAAHERALQEERERATRERRVA